MRRRHDNPPASCLDCPFRYPEEGVVQKLNALRAGIRFFAFLGLLAATATLAHATDWPRSDIPADPAVTFGTLPNGMRYAIMRNRTPSDQVSIRFRIAAGSMQETAAQRGLAHFLEHMAFRGSLHLAD